MPDEHTRIEELLSAMQDDAATPEDTALVESATLATCARCRATASAPSRRLTARCAAT